MPWFKGNTHTHTNRSDGDSPPEEVIAWYRSHGYHFLALTDHSRVTDPGEFQHLQDEQFILIPGEELSDRCEGKPLHINGLNLTAAIPEQGGDTIPEVLQRSVNAIEEAGATAHINHPNFRYAITSADLLATPRFRLLEVFNGHPACFNDGDAEQGKVSVESMWDDLLTAGCIVYAMAVDDAHHLLEFSPHRANPGRGWVVANAPELTPSAIVSSLAAGQFYASTGVGLRSLASTPGRIALTVEPMDGETYRIDFIGTGGETLLSVDGEEASCHPRPEHLYVRARVTGSSGARCWTQPIFTKG